MLFESNGEPRENGGKVKAYISETDPALRERG